MCSSQLLMLKNLGSSVEFSSTNPSVNFAPPHCTLLNLNMEICKSLQTLPLTPVIFLHKNSQSDPLGICQIISFLCSKLSSSCFADSKWRQNSQVIDLRFLCDLMSVPCLLTHCASVTLATLLLLQHTSSPHMHLSVFSARNTITLKVFAWLLPSSSLRLCLVPS